MTLRNVNTPDNAPGVGQGPMLARSSRTVEAETSLIQLIDQWDDEETALCLQLPPTSITLPLLAAGIGFRPVIQYRVPTGKVFIPKWMYTQATGSLNYLVRASRRYRLWSFSGATIAAPATPGAPAGVVNQSINMPTGAVSYKLTGINNVGETTPSAASANVTVASTSAIEFTFAAPTGARRIGIYRTASGNGTAGPWLYLHEIERSHASPYRDTHPDADLDAARQPPGANGTAGNVQGETSATGVSEIQFVVQDVALAASPNRIIYTDEDGTQENVLVTVTTTVNTQTRVPLKNEGLGGSGVFDAQAATAFNLRGGEVNAGLKNIVAIGANPATGQYNIYGFHPLGFAGYEGGAATAVGQNVRWSRFLSPVAMPAGSEFVVELAHPQGLTPAALVYEVTVMGQLLTV